MPKLKLTDRDRRIMVELKEECPCITNAALARIFHVSQSRVGEIIRASVRDMGVKKYA